MVHNTIPTHPYLLFQLDGAVWWGGGKGGVGLEFVMAEYHATFLSSSYTSFQLHQFPGSYRL